MPGRIYIKCDLANTVTPIQILSVCASTLPALVQNPNFNEVNGIWEEELATYTASTTAISGLTTKFKRLTSVVTPYITTSKTETVPGKTIDATVLSEIFTTYLTASLTLYVATTGNDTTGTGAVGKPYATISKALSVIPKNLNGCSAIINIANGAYSESVIVSDFHGGELTLQILAGASVTVSRLIVKGSVIVNIASTTSAPAYLFMNSTTDIPFLVYKAAFVKNAYVNITINGNSAYDGMVVTEFSQYHAATANTITVNNANSGVVVVNSKVYFYRISGSGNVTGIYVLDGGIASYEKNTISAITPTQKLNGGIITNELYPTKKTITWGSGNTPQNYNCYKVGDMVHIDLRMPFATAITQSTEIVGTVPADCRPLVATPFVYGGRGFLVSNPAEGSSIEIAVKVETNGNIYLTKEVVTTGDVYGASFSIEYFVN
jgi:hypothetical protein